MAFVPTNALVPRSIGDSTLRVTSTFGRALQTGTANSARRVAKPCSSGQRWPIKMQAVDGKTREIFMPALSSTMTEGKIVQWLKRPGDPVSNGEAIMVVESDKADMDVESFEDGFLAKIIIDEGESCPVGDPVALIVDTADDVVKLQSVSPKDTVESPSPSTGNGTPETTVTVTAPASSAATTGSSSGDSGVSAAAPSATPMKPDFIDISMPALSSTMTEGKIVEWLKTEGDLVTAGEMVMVVQSDKADMEVESFDGGILAHISIPVGSSAPVGNPVAYLAKSPADVPAIKAWASYSSASEAPVASSSEVTAATPTSNSSASQVPASVPAPKVVNEGRIIASPRAKAVAKEQGVDLRYVVGTGPNGRIVERDVLKAKANEVPGGVSMPSPAPSASTGKLIATPDAKKVAKKEGVDLNSVKGTGNFGRITADDVLRAAGKESASVSSNAAVEKTTTSVVKGKPISTPDADKKVESPAGSVALNAMQKAVVNNMNASLTVPVFRITYKIGTTALDELYGKVKPKGVTMSALIAKAVALTLRKHPIMNAAYAGDAIIYRDEINIAMAVSMPDGGLITPTLKKADETDLYSLSRSWKDLVKRAGDKKLSPSEYSGGTFVISNLGMFGVEQFDAILPPDVPGILAVAASQPTVKLLPNGLVGVEKVMSVTLTADHRHIYGADGAKFLRDLAQLIENDVTELVM